MDNIDLLYDNSDYSNTDTESEYSNNEVNSNYKIKVVDNNIIINTVDRDWSNLYKETFSFSIKFNNMLTTNNNDISIDNVHNDLKITQLEDLKNNNIIINNIESPSLSILIEIKNIYMIEIDSLLIPPRYIYLKNSNFINILDLDGISLVIEEYDKICFGTNSILNKSFCNLIPDNCDTTENCNNLIQFNNINKTGKIFYPALLNTINTLTIKLYDLNGNELKYFNDSLGIKKIKNLKNSNFLEIETTNYFSRLNYREGDVIVIKNISMDNNNIKLFLENEEHQIFYNSDFTKVKNLNIETLINKFYIKKKGEYNLNGTYEIISDLNNISGQDILLDLNDDKGALLNKNLQIKIFMNIRTKEREILFESILI